MSTGPASTPAHQGERDYTVDLNNFLQGHPTGNLTPFFQYVMTREGRGDNPTHVATAEFPGVERAVGRAANKGAAKRDAAKQVYENFLGNGVPHDHAIELNLFLQSHPTGNLTPFLHYVISKEGRDDAPIYIAIIKFRYIEAAGNGTNRDTAKSDAAKKVYEYFLGNGVPANEEPELLTSVLSIG